VLDHAELDRAADGQNTNGNAESTRATVSFSRDKAAATYSRQNPYTARLKQVLRLNHPDSAKDTRQVVIDLGTSGIEYLPGDSLGVYPRNCPELAKSIIERLGADHRESVALQNGSCVTAEDALLAHCTITKVSDGVLTLLANHAQKAREQEELRGMLTDDRENFLETADLLDVLERFPSIRLPIAELVNALPPILPRLYSIASSLRAHPGEVHLTVGVVRYNQRARARKGVCSTFLAERIQPGEALAVFVQPAHGFRLPADPSAPLIMVGPGTGIAPFRAFLEERAACGASGKNWLLFGDQHCELDFLYREELEELQKCGVLTRLDTAWSRAQSHKVYVQDRMREQAPLLWHWLQEGACFYVCGDAKRMAPDVDSALIEVAEKQGKLSPADAKAFVRQLAKEKRYLRDVY
jgi:sulfite reductase (NADPH) flavoprotein alpha-component